MKNPCLRCVVYIICGEMCDERTEYTQHWQNILKDYERKCRTGGTINNFNKSYYHAYITVENIIRDNLNILSRRNNQSTCGSSGPSLSSSSKCWSRRDTHRFDKNYPAFVEKRNSYLK